MAMAVAPYLHPKMSPDLPTVEWGTLLLTPSGHAGGLWEIQKLKSIEQKDMQREAGALDQLGHRFPGHARVLSVL